MDKVLQKRGNAVRKHFLDNIRWTVVCLAAIYHVCYNYNSSGVIKNVVSQGIPQMDILLPFVYPWFMALLFLVAGVGANYALKNRTKKQFIGERARKLLIPSVGVLFLIGWTMGWVTSQYTGMFGAADTLPIAVRYLIYAFTGIGPLWFLHELFLASVVLVIVLSLDKKNVLTRLSECANVWTAFLLLFTVWGASQICNMPLITVYRGVYIWVFLLGYYVFSNEKLQEDLTKFCYPLLGLFVVTGVIYSYVNYGMNYADTSNMKTFFTNFYAWLGILTIFSCFKRWFDFSAPLTAYMTKKSFAIYVLHCPVMTLLVYVLTEYVHFPIIMNYIVTLLGTILIVFLLDAVISRIPPLRFLIYGQKRKRA